MNPRFLLFALPFLLPLPVQSAPTAPVTATPEQAPLSISAALSKTTFKEDEPVDVAVTLLNTGTKTVFLGGSAYELSKLHFDLKRADGTPVARTEFGKRA